MKKFNSIIAYCLLVVMISCSEDEPESLATVTTVQVTSVTSSGFLSGGDITGDGGSAITQRGIAWSTQPGPTVEDSITNDGKGTGVFTTAFLALNANTTYYLRAYAINATGTAYGEEVSATTAEGVPTVTTTVVSDIQPLSAESGGIVSNDGGASVTERGLVYATTPNPTISDFKVIAGTGTGPFTATLTPLASQTTYYARAYAVNGYGTAYGNQLQFNSASANAVSDIDGNVYPYVSVCGKDWFAMNLKTSRYKNGDAILDGSIGEFDWLTTSGAFTYPDGKQAYNATYGKLYNLEAILDNRGVCPEGWHVPTDADWQAAEICQGMSPAIAACHWAECDPNRCCGGLKFLEGGGSGLEVKMTGEMFVDQSTGITKFAGFGSFAEYYTTTLNPPTGENDPNDYYIFRGFGPGHYSLLSADEILRRAETRGHNRPVRCVRD